MKKIVLAILALLAVILAATYAVYNKIDDYVVAIGGEKVTKSEYLLMFKVQCDKLLSENNIYSIDMKREFWNKKIDGKYPKDIVNERTLDKIKEMEIQLDKAREYGLALSDADKKSAKEYVENLKKSVSGSSDKTAVEEEFVKQYGVTSKQYEPLYEKILLIRKLVSEESGKMQITDDEMKTYYDKFKDNVDNFTIRDILFATVNLETSEALAADKQQEAGNRAITVLNSAREGENLEKLALDNSDDPNVKDNKGVYTFKVNAQDQNEIEKWVLKAKVGDMAIVKTFYGYHIVKLEKRSSYDEVKQDVREILFEGKYMDLLDTWKKDPKYNMSIKNPGFINSIDITKY